MPNYYITEANFDPSVVSKYEEILKCFEQTLNMDYHIFVEFKVPSGREIDFIIISRHGAWLLEHKQHDFVEILVDGNWKYINRHGQKRELVKKVKTGYENPYKQATNSADNFSLWLQQNRHISDELRNRKKIFPCVAFPGSETKVQKQKQDNWCYLSKGMNGIQRNIDKRRWARNDWISESTIEKIASTLNLERISFTDLFRHKSNLEKIFRETAKGQIKEIKRIFNQTHQLLDDNEWIFSISLLEEDPSTRPRKTKVTDFTLDTLPFLLTGEFGSGKTIACYQIMESLLENQLGFYLPLREILVQKMSESTNKIHFKGNEYIYPINVDQDLLENVGDTISNITIFLLKSLIATYNEKGLLEQITSGINSYLKELRFFIILDGWDEIPSNSFSLINKIIDYFLLNDISIIISCRRPADSHLSHLRGQGKEIPKYLTLPPSDEQIRLYIKERLKAWTNTVTVDKIVLILRETFRDNITPFYLFGTTIVPIDEPPKNSAQLIRWTIIAQVGWELLKNHRDYIKKITTLKDLIQILKKEEIFIALKQTSFYNAISESIETSNDIFPNGSIRGIVGNIALCEITGTQTELSGTTALEINPIIAPFIDLLPHPEGLYLYPRLKSKLLQDYFLAERALEILVVQGSITNLFSLDVYFLFSQLLIVDKRWRASLKTQGKEVNSTKLLVQYLTTYPVKLRPTARKPSFEVIGGGMRQVHSRMSLGIPGWYSSLLSACITKIRSLMTISHESQNDAIIAFLKLQRTIPEVTSDRIYDGYIKDEDDPQISQSLDPDYFLNMVLIIFAEYTEKRSIIMDLVDVYCQKMKAEKAERKRENQDKEDEEDWYDYPIDTYYCENDTYNNLSFLFSILDYSGSPGLRQWAESVISDMSLTGDLISSLLKEEIPLTSVNGLLLRYLRLTSSYLDSELGVLFPGDYDFDEILIVKCFIEYTIRGASQRTLKMFWNLLLHFSKDLNLIELLLNNLELFDVDTLGKLYQITLLHYFDDYPKKKPQVELLIQNIDRFRPISMILTYENFLSFSSIRIPLTQDEFHWLLTENLDKIVEEQIRRKTSTLKPSIGIKKDLTALLKESTFENRTIWELRERFKIFQIALLNKLEIEPNDLAAIILEFDQIDWVLQFFNISPEKISDPFRKTLFSSLSPKMKAFKTIIEDASLNPIKIAFFRMTTHQDCSKFLTDIQLSDKEVEIWLRKSELKGNLPLNDDWMALEKLISTRLPTYFKNSEFRTFFSDVINNDTNSLVNPKNLAELMINYYARDNSKDDQHNWKEFFGLLTEEFLTRILKTAMKEYSIDNPIFSLALYAYPFHNHKIDTFLLKFFDKNSKEGTRVYHSNLTSLSRRLLNLHYFNALSTLVHHASITNLVHIVYALRKTIFPENSDEIIQITPTITGFAENNNQELTSILNLIIDRLYDELDKIEDSEDASQIIGYCFDLLIGLKTERWEKLLELFFLTSITHYDSVDWMDREIQYVIDNKAKYQPLLQKKKALLSEKRDEATRPYEKERNEKIIKKIDRILSYFNGSISLEALKITKIDSKHNKPFVKGYLPTYRLSTTTKDWNDFSEAIKDLTTEERLEFILRLMYGREVIVIDKEIIIKDSFDLNGKFNVQYPNDKEIGIRILLNSLDPEEILEIGRQLDGISNKQWFGFLNHFVEISPLEKVKSTLKAFKGDEYEAINVSYILKSIVHNIE